MLPDLKVTAETRDHRAPEVSRVQLAPQEKQERGVAMELTVLEECQESLEARVTEVLTASPVFPERKDTGANMVLQVLQDLQEMTAQEAKMARLDREAWLERVVLEVCWGPEGLQVLQDSVVLLDLMVKLVPKETWVHKESQDLLVSRVRLVHMVSLVLKVRSGLPVKKDLKVNKVWLVLLVLTAPLVTRAKKVLQARKEELVPLVLWDPSATPGLAV